LVVHDVCDVVIEDVVVVVVVVIVVVVVVSLQEEKLRSIKNIQKKRRIVYSNTAFPN